MLAGRRKPAIAEKLKGGFRANRPAARPRVVGEDGAPMNGRAAAAHSSSRLKFLSGQDSRRPPAAAEGQANLIAVRQAAPPVFRQRDTAASDEANLLRTMRVDNQTAADRLAASRNPEGRRVMQARQIHDDARDTAARRQAQQRAKIVYQERPASDRARGRAGTAHDQQRGLRAALSKEAVDTRALRPVAAHKEGGTTRGTAAGSAAAARLHRIAEAEVAALEKEARLPHVTAEEEAAAATREMEVRHATRVAARSVLPHARAWPAEDGAGGEQEAAAARAEEAEEARAMESVVATTAAVSRQANRKAEVRHQDKTEAHDATRTAALEEEVSVQARPARVLTKATRRIAAPTEADAPEGDQGATPAVGSQVPRPHPGRAVRTVYDEEEVVHEEDETPQAPVTIRRKVGFGPRDWGVPEEGAQGEEDQEGGWRHQAGALKAPGGPRPLVVDDSEKRHDDFVEAGFRQGRLPQKAASRVRFEGEGGESGPPDVASSRQSGVGGGAALARNLRPGGERGLEGGMGEADNQGRAVGGLGVGGARMGGRRVLATEGDTQEAEDDYLAKAAHHLARGRRGGLAGTFRQEDGGDDGVSLDALRVQSRRSTMVKARRRGVDAHPQAYGQHDEGEARLGSLKATIRASMAGSKPPAAARRMVDVPDAAADEEGAGIGGRRFQGRGVRVLEAGGEAAGGVGVVAPPRRSHVGRVGGGFGRQSRWAAVPDAGEDLDVVDEDARPGAGSGFRARRQAGMLPSTDGVYDPDPTMDPLGRPGLTKVWGKEVAPAHVDGGGYTAYEQTLTKDSGQPP